MTETKRGATVLAVLALAIAGALAVPSRAAEQAVGLEARGVDPNAALHNDLGLDVRDAEGHPVSAALINQQLAAAHREKVSEGAALSRLPKARLVFRLLDLIHSLGGSWSLPFEMFSAAAVWALPARPKSDQADRPAAVATLAGLCLALACCRSLTISRRSPQKTEVLRC
jgi:hypothetical protein